MNSSNQLINVPEKSFFENFTIEQIFTAYQQCSNLLELAKKLGYQGDHLTRADYAYINKCKTREVWLQYLKKGRFEQERKAHVQNLSPEELKATMNSPGIETVSHRATHYLLSQRHGRDVLKECIEKHQLKDFVPDELYKGFFGVGRTPWLYPKKQYEQQQGPKPLICERCSFQAVDSQQMEIHHKLQSGARGSKLKKGTIAYHTSEDLEVICANCHSLEHRNGKDLQASCGQWHREPPNQLSYENPDDIFNDDCPFNHTVQKRYLLRWHFNSPDEYKCQKCNVTSWGPSNEILVLEIHHVDGIRKNSTLANLELLCPNCHRLFHTITPKGQPASNTPKPPLKRVYLPTPSSMQKATTQLTGSPYEPQNNLEESQDSPETKQEPKAGPRDEATYE